MRTDSFPSIIGVRNAKTKERNSDADLDEVIAKMLDEPNRNPIGTGLLGWTKRAHGERMRTYGRPETLLLGIPENENNVGAHPTLMRASSSLKHGNYNVSVSKQTVNGPSFVSDTSIIAPKTPVWTRGSSASPISLRANDTKCS